MKRTYISWTGISSPPGLLNPKIENDIRDTTAKYLGFYPDPVCPAGTLSCEASLCIGTVSPEVPEPDPYEISNPPVSGLRTTVCEMDIFGE